MLIRTLILFTILLVLVSSAAFAQPTIGLPPFGSFSGGPFDTVNNANLNVYFQIPIINKAGRAGMNFNYALSYDSSIWAPVSASGSQAWTPNPATTWGWRTVTNAPQAIVGYVTYQTNQSACLYHPGLPDQQLYYYTVYFNFAYVDPLGSSHPVPLTLSDANSVPCGGGGFTNTGTATTSDGSGYQITATTNSNGTAYLTSVVATNGTSLVVVGGLNGSATSQDSNGNKITTNSGNPITVTDTLNTAVLTIALGLPTTLTYTNPQSTNSHYTVNYTSKTVQTAFGCLGVSEYGPITGVNLVSSITLPDGSYYAFEYEQTSQGSQNVTGRIASVRLPTGGTITYTYSGGSNGITCADGSTATLARQTPDGSWTYAHSEQASPNPWLTTVTDPLGGVTSLKFQGTQGEGW